MIAKLAGKVVDIFPDYLILDVQGVGYRIEGAGQIAQVNESLSLYIYTVVREQELRLFGFKFKEELELFELLLSVSGIGPKSALNIITAIDYKTILAAINSNEPGMIKAPGVGTKTAERLVLELKQKIGKNTLLNQVDLRATEVKGKESSVQAEAFEALMSLGYHKEQAKDMLQRVESDKINSSEDLVKAALTNINK